MVMLGECPDDMHPSQLGCHNYFGYLKVDDVDAHCAQVKQAGGELTSALANKPWGMREFGVKSPDGHRIMIGEEILESFKQQERD